MSLKQIAQDAINQSIALQRKNAETRPRLVQSITIPLDTAATIGKPFKLTGPFDSFWVSGATDTAVNVGMGIVSRDDYNLRQLLPLSLNVASEFSEPITDAFLIWPAQAGKTITLILGLGVKVKPGSTISITSGGVSINSGSAMATAVVALVAATATQIFATNANRKQGTFVNDSGATIWIGGAAVSNAGANKGLPIVNGASFVWQNTAPLYGYHVAGYATLSTMTET